MLAAYLLLDVSWEAASYGATDLDPAVASFAFDLGNLGFANIWLAMGSFAVCCGWVVLSTRILRRWLGWWAIVAGLADSGPIRPVGRDLDRAVCTLLAVGDHCLHPADPPKDRFAGGDGCLERVPGERPRLGQDWLRSPFGCLPGLLIINDDQFLAGD